MFWDEMERIDQKLNSGVRLARRRIRAYYEFRDRSEPVERVGHIRGPGRTEIAIGDSPAPVQAPELGPSLQEYLPVSPGEFLKWTCRACGRFVFMWADSEAPHKCPQCGGAQMSASAWTERAA